MSRYIPDYIKLVLFDNDDTLVGTYQPIWDMFRYTAKNHYDIELSDKDILLHWGKPIRELAKHYYQTDDIDSAIDIIERNLPYFPKKKFDYTTKIFTKLKNDGKSIGIVSATYLNILTDDFKRLEIPIESLDYIQTAENSNYHKPNPKVFEPMFSWASMNNIKKDEILYIGDSLFDVQATQKAALNFLGVETGLLTAEKFTELGADSIKDLSVLL